MVDLFKSTQIGKWNRADESPLVISIMYIFFLLIFVIIFLVTPNIDIFFIIIIMFPIGLFIINIIIMIGLYLSRKGYYLTMLNHDNITTVKLIDNALKQNNIEFSKLNQGDYISIFILKYIEIYNIPESDLNIRILKERSRGSLIEVGPENPNNIHLIENIEKIIDTAFQPKGLNL